MIWKLSLTGIKSRFKDYLVLFSGLVVASMIFYMFLTLAINPAFLKNNAGILEDNLLTYIFGFGIVLLLIITVVYLVYANTFLLSMRKHDYGMFLTLGAKSSRIGLLIFCETIITGVLAAALGIILGFGLTAIVGHLLISKMGLAITHFQIILPSAIFWTLVFFVIVFLLGALRNGYKLTHTKVIDLLHEDQEPVKFSHRPVLHLIEAILGLLLLAIGYWIMQKRGLDPFNVIPIALVTIVAGSYFVLNFLFTAIISSLIKRHGFSYHGLRMFTLGQLKFRLHDYTKILTVISLLFALALGAITVGLNFNSEKELAKSIAYYDVTVVSQSSAVQKELAKVAIKSEQTYHYTETKHDLYFDQAEFKNKPIKTVESKGQSDNIAWTEKTLPTSQLDRPGTEANNKFGNLVPNGVEKKIRLVSQATLAKVKGQQKFVSLIRVKDFDKDFPVLLKIEQLEKKEIPAYGMISNNSKSHYYQGILGIVSGFEFMGFFLGLAFLTMLASTLMFKVLSSAASDKLRYQMLFKIGTRRRILKRSVAEEIGMLFLIPGVLGVIDVLFGLQLFRTILYHPYAGIWLPFTIFIVLYFFYYVLTVHLYEKIVLAKN
ncbi:FtsX-like permease family protein [Lactobacillus sp. ESL0679]|uniref:ABC transporter permease n=1 Tax=Lactobacillus sp. ESL0679 TaxID=2983209 RepID=UPI0023F7D72D|nr:FtsX-like permease family protein [Lactobacillus sp. ESL0679]MDF7682889.1 FtsX-like permease family protein [Lactobacillus sp. ESL0679]